MNSRIALPTVIAVLLSQAFAGANVKNCRPKEQHRRRDENNVKHECFLLFLSACFASTLKKPDLERDGNCRVDLVSDFLEMVANVLDEISIFALCSFFPVTHLSQTLLKEF